MTPTTQFPLYDILYTKIQDSENLNTELTLIQKQSIISFITSAPEQIHEIVYVLIRIFQLQHETQHFSLPYGAKQIKKGIKFNINKFPKTLSQIIHQFILTHTHTNSFPDILDHTHESFEFT